MFKQLRDWIKSGGRLKTSDLSKESDCPKCGAKADKIYQGDTFWYLCWNCNEEFGQSWKA